jgi:dihydrodipicolinate synthase/N-acetylneuraminate lyase
VCKGKVFIGSNAAEVHTARDTIEQAKIAIGAGVDVVNIYGPAGWHGYRPNREEYLTFFDRILTEVKYPVSVAPNPTALDYLPEASWIADICNKHMQVVSVNFGGIYDDTYLIELKDRFVREVETYITMPFALSGFAMGATGLNAWEANILPKTYRSFLDYYDAGSMSDVGRLYTDIRRFEKFVHSNYHERWFKMALKVFKLPGGKGGFREPYLMPGDDVLEQFAASLMALNIPEIDEMARTAGLA